MIEPIIEFSFSEPTEEDIRLENLQKDTLTKLDDMGYGIKVAEGIYLPMPCLIHENNYPIEICNSDNQPGHIFQNWEEIQKFYDSLINASEK